MNLIFKYSDCTHGVLDIYTQEFIYNKYRDIIRPGKSPYLEDQDRTIVDFIGFIDRDIEQLIEEGK